MSGVLRGLADGLARMLGLAMVLGVGAYLAWPHLADRSDATSELREANPAWTVEKPRTVGLRLVDASGTEVFVNTDDVGPLRLQRLECPALAASLPGWLRLPPGRTVACVQMGGPAAPLVRVLNHRTAVPVAELWERHFQSLLDELQLPYWGGSSGGGRGAGASMSYSVDPAPDDSTGPQVNLMAFRRDGETVLVVTLRIMRAP